MKLSIKAGSTSQSLLIFILDSSSTTGAGLTGLAYNTGSLVCYYARPGATAASVSLATQTVTGAFSSGGFVEISSANMPGLYRFDPPDAALATGARSVVFVLKGATNMTPLPIEVELTGWDNQDAVHGGMSALPNAAAAAANGLLTFGTGSGQLNPASGIVSANVTQTDGVAYHNYDGVAQTGGASTITLQAGSSTVTGAYVGWRIAIVGGTGAGQSRVITAYNTGTMVATVDTAWGTQPDSTSEYVFGTPADRTIVGSGGIVAASFATGAIDANAVAQAAADKAWSTATRTLTSGSGLTVAGITGVTFPTNFASTVIDSSGRVQVQSGTGAGQLSITSGKVAATLVSTDVTGNVASDVQTIKTQAITCGAGVTVNPNVGTATAAPVVDGSGRVQVQSGTGAGQISITSGQVAATLDATASANLADAILGRDTSTIQGTMPKHCLGVLVHGFTKWTIQGSNLIIMDTVTGAALYTLPLTVGPSSLGVVTGVDSAS